MSLIKRSASSAVAAAFASTKNRAPGRGGRRTLARRKRWLRSTTRIGLLLTAFVTGCLAWAAEAQSSIYMNAYSNDGTQLWIGRANLSGSAIKPRLAPDQSLGCGLASDGRHLYWINPAAETFGGGVGRSNIDGTGVNQSFIATSPPPQPYPTNVNECGVAVDSAHVYWASSPVFDPGVKGPISIARANLDGSNVDYSFISNVSAPNTPLRQNHSYTPPEGQTIPSIVVSGGHVYWANLPAGTIGRANVDGSGVNLNFVTGAYAPGGIALDGGHVYWTNGDPDGGPGGNSIGRANLDGSGVIQRLISGLDLADPCGLAVFGTQLYWTIDCRAGYKLNESYGAVGRANTNGTHVTRHLVASDNASATAIVVDGGAAAGCNGKAARIGGRATCLRRGQRCVRRYKRQYRRHGFSCQRRNGKYRLS